MAVLATKYNLNADIKRGETKVLYLNGHPIAYLKKHSFSSKTDVEELATKFSGRYDDKLGGKTSYTITCEALVSNTAGHISASALRHLQYKGDAVPFEICQTTVQENPDGSKQIDKGAVVCKGNVIVSDVGEESEKGQFETVSLTLEGSGALFDAANKPFGDATAIASLFPRQ